MTTPEASVIVKASDIADMYLFVINAYPAGFFLSSLPKYLNTHTFTQTHTHTHTHYTHLLCVDQCNDSLLVNLKSSHGK